MKKIIFFVEKAEEFLAEMLLKILFILFLMIPFLIEVVCLWGLFLSGINGPIFWALTSLLSLLIILSIGSIKDFFLTKKLKKKFTKPLS